MRFALLLVAALSASHAQDPYSTLPRNYRVELENEAVRVSRSRYFPGDKLAAHAHPSIPTVYVYLSDGGRTIFRHQTPRFTVERPAVKAGGVRFNRNAKVENHQVEYLGDAPAETLRVELKTRPAREHKDARLLTEGEFPTEQSWQDGQVRIVRSTKPQPLGTRRALLIDIDQRAFTWYDPAKGGSPRTPTTPGRYVTLELKD
jgi:hypothetical protein